MASSSCIELSAGALAQNVKFLRKELGKGVTITSVIKGNAYGHGIETFVPMAESCGINHFSVFDADEALRAHQAMSQDSELMIMGYMDLDAIAWAIGNDISFYVFDLVRLESALKTAEKMKRPARIHLELETGLNRTGIPTQELKRVVELINRNRDFVVLFGVCTHFAGAESIANYKRIQDQIETFESQCNRLQSVGLTFASRHTASSAAALSYPTTRMDMVRIGIAQYGFWPSEETRMQFLMRPGNQSKKRNIDPLKRVLRWSSRVMSIKDVRQGEFVSYGTAYLTTRPQKIAAVPIGYFHGYRRGLSNLGRVLIRGRRAGVIGTVNMNMILVNISEIPGVEVGDEVVIIGKQNKTEITVTSFSDMSNLLNYEALVRLPSEIPRVVVP